MLRRSTIFWFLAFAIVSISGFVPIVYGQGPGPVPAPGSEGITVRNPLTVCTFAGIADAIARFLFSVGLAFATIMILVTAFLYLSSGGNEEKVRKAHRAFVWTLAGIAILLISGGIAFLLADLLGGLASSPPSVGAPCP